VRAGPSVLAAALVGLVAAPVACGSSPPSELPVPEPAASPAPRERPAGRVVDVGNAPEGVVADPATGLVALGFRNPDRLALVDGRSGEVIRRVPLPSSPRHLGLARPGGPVLAPTEAGGTLVEVTLPEGKIASTTRVGRGPHDAAAGAGRAFVGNEFEDTVSVVERGRELRRLPAARQPGGVATTATGEVGVVAVTGRVLEAHDARSLRPLGHVSGGVGPTHVVAEPEGCYYVVDTQGDAVLVIDRRGPALRHIRRINVAGSPYGIALDAPADRLWVTQTARNAASEYALNGGRPVLVRRLPTVRQPNSVAVDPRSGRAYVAGRAGELQIIPPSPTRRAPPRPDDGWFRCR
jgi:DNA-binding beta-propeller fold protein YncE